MFFRTERIELSSRYVIGTGWWCDGTGQHAGSTLAHNRSADLIREKHFFGLWYHFVTKYTNPSKIIIVDSNSPVKPDLPDDPRIEFLSLQENFGHYRDCDVRRMCGVERVHLGCAMYAYINDCDLVYIEQDCLVIGEDWVEHCMAHMRKGKIMYGHGKGTPQPQQQSLVIVKREFIPEFMSRLIHHFNVARRKLIKGVERGRVSPERRWHKAFRWDVDYIPFGHGRARPLDMTDRYFYAQHWTEHEIEQLLKREHLELLQPDGAGLLASVD